MNLRFCTSADTEIGVLIVLTLAALTRLSVAAACAGVLRSVLPSGAGIPRIVRPLRQLNSAEPRFRRRVASRRLPSPLNTRVAGQFRASRCLRYGAELVTDGRHGDALGPFRTPPAHHMGLSNSRIERSRRQSALWSDATVK